MQRSAKLVDDQTYITAQATLSQKPYQYYTAFPPALPVKTFPRACTPYSGGCAQGHVSSDTVDDFNSLYVSAATRPNPRPNTELFGMPFKARGDGPLKAPDTFSALRYSGFNPHCPKGLSEIDYDRYECIQAPLMVEDERLMGAPRGGSHTRVGPAYYMC